MKHTLTMWAASGLALTHLTAAELIPPLATEAVQAATTQVQAQTTSVAHQVAQAAQQLQRAQQVLTRAQAQVPMALAQAQHAMRMAQAQPPAAVPSGAVVAPAATDAPAPPSGGFGGGGGFGAAGGIGGGGGGVFSFGRRDLAQPLIVRASEGNPATLGDIQEDMTVMSRILTKALAEGGSGDAQDFAMGIVVSALGGDQRIRSLYLEGYGALFLLNVQMPLLPPPPVKATERKQPPPDTTWEQTKRELYGPPRGQPGAQRLLGYGGYGAGALIRPGEPGGSPALRYDAEKVDALKKHLLEALQNATNIRHLKSDEWITVAVTSGGTRPGQPPGAAQLLTPYLEMPNGEVMATSPNGEPIPNPPVAVRPGNARTTLTIRVKKADVDAFAKGKLSLDEFQHKASIVTY